MNDTQHMRAIVQNEYGSTEKLSLGETERPVPADGEVLVRVAAAGVDPGVWHLMTGLPYLVRLAGYGLRRPKTPVPGSDIAGRIEAVGRSVDALLPGDEVFGVASGAFAEYALSTPDRLAAKPANVSFEEAAVVPTSGLAALQGLRDAGGLRPGQRVLIVGATGGVGTFAVQLAKALGAEVTGVGSTGKLEMLRSIGADHVVDYTREDFAASGERYDLILDIAGNRSLAHLRRALSPRGTLVIVGGEAGGRWIGGTDRQLRTLLASPFTAQTLRPLFSAPRKADLEFLRQALTSGSLRPWIDRTYPLEAAADAVRHIAEGHSRGKTALSLDPSPSEHPGTLGREEADREPVASLVGSAPRKGGLE